MFITKKEHEKVVSKLKSQLAAEKKRNKELEGLVGDDKMPSEAQIVDMMNDYEYRANVYRKVFANAQGRAVIEFLKTFYNQSTPNFEPYVDYFTQGKRRAILEIEQLINKPVKKKEKMNG